MEGPAVSLQGSPTVSPVTAAMCVSVFFRPWDSQYFLVLSQAPPPLFKNKAIKIPVEVENIKKAHTALGPSSYCPVMLPTNLKTKETAMGERKTCLEGKLSKIVVQDGTLQAMVGMNEFSIIVKN